MMFVTSPEKVEVAESDEFPLEYVEWWDHSSFKENCWRPIDEINDLDPVTIRTVGWLTKETEDYIILTSTLARPQEGYTQNGEHSMCILKGVMKDRRRI